MQFGSLIHPELSVSQSVHILMWEQNPAVGENKPGEISLVAAAARIPAGSCSFP